ncbi:uncharacterized protein LOC122791341 isoform X2 [Protopterus annectens]|uniref:uncharacterized protein LOC122791341 isoform X2 n=1 Tax=Protopterus annectens TaxID=7888 RepID=UPI001CFACD1C|nr:uncharacterized protein LOC122791341 isoform X2 [Protopterus annectens]
MNFGCDTGFYAMNLIPICCLIFAPVAGAIIHVIGVEGEAVLLTFPLTEGSEAIAIDWRYKKQQTETKIASFAHGIITTDDDIQFNTRLILNTTVVFLQIEPLHLQDSGLYVVEIKLQDKRKVFERFNLTVYVKISNTFLKKKAGSNHCTAEESGKLADVSSKHNCSFILECGAEKGNYIHFYWQKSGANLTRWISDCSPHSVNCSLMEVPTDQENCNANYSCTASNVVSTETKYIIPCFTAQEKTCRDRYFIGLSVVSLMLVAMGLSAKFYIRQKNEGKHKAVSSLKHAENCEE